jgi:hypothetical protein
MIFGDPTAFAVEAFHEPAEKRFLGFGRMCIHIQGLALGDLSEEHCSLYHSADDLKHLAAHAASLWHPRFDGLTDVEVFHLLAQTLFDYHGQSDEEIDKNFKQYGRFSVLTNSGEHFDGFNIFVICRNALYVHFLFRLPDGTIGSRFCLPQQMIRSIQQFQSWFHSVSAEQGAPGDGFAAPEL